MQKSLIAVPMLLVTVVLSASTTVAQDRDPIDTARTFPPTHYKETDLALTQIDWQLQHLKQTRKKQSDDFKNVAERLEFSRQKAKELTESLPAELRFANEDVRSQVIGTCLAELLTARLEVASNEAIISQLSMELEKANEERTGVDLLKKQQQELKIQAAKTKLALVVSEYDTNKKMYLKGSKTRQEAERSKYSLQIAEHELAHARIEMEIESNSRANEIAQRLVEARIEMQPIKARVVAAEKFLELFSDSSDTINQIEELNRSYQFRQEAFEEFNRKMWASYDQIAELEALKELIHETLKEAEMRKKLEEKKKEKSEEKKD